jgi:polyisoprenoid-binding protein YceI
MEQASFREDNSMTFKFRTIFAGAFLAALVALPLSANAQSKWLPYEGHLQVHFMIDHNGLSTQIGTFRNITGEMTMDENKPEDAQVSVRIEAASLDTAHAYRDNFVREVFLNARKFRYIDFKSTKVERTGDKTAKLTGDLTMHGVTHPVTLDVTFRKAGKRPSGADHYGFVATGSLNRLDWGIDAFSSKSPPAVTGEKIDMRIAAEFVRQ